MCMVSTNCLSSLSECLNALPLHMTQELPQRGDHVTIVCAAADEQEALRFVDDLGAKPVALCLFDADESHNKNGPYGIGRVGFDNLNMFPEATILLYSPEYFSVPVKKSNGFFAAKTLLRHVGHFTLAPALKHDTWHTRRFPDMYSEHGRQLEDIFTKLKDDSSRIAFAQAVKMLLTGNPGYCRPAPYAQYFHPDVCVRGGDTVVDGGTHSLAECKLFAEATGTDGQVLCFEPEPSLYQRLAKEAADLPSSTYHIRPFHCGLGASSFSCYIVSEDAGSWMTNKPRAGASKVMMRDLDSLLIENGIKRVDVIKLDVEGCECDVLRGAAECIRRDKPRLMISGYHRKDDLITIPALLHSIEPAYTLCFACHECFVGEFLYYAQV